MGGHDFGIQFAAGVDDLFAQFDTLGVALLVLKSVTAQITADGGNFHAQILDVLEQISPLGTAHFDEGFVGAVTGVDLNALNTHLGGGLQCGMQFFAK